MRYYIIRSDDDYVEKEIELKMKQLVENRIKKSFQLGVSGIEELKREITYSITKLTNKNLFCELVNGVIMTYPKDNIITIDEYFNTSTEYIVINELGKYITKEELLDMFLESLSNNTGRNFMYYNNNPEYECEIINLRELNIFIVKDKLHSSKI